MTYREKLQKEHPECVKDWYWGGCLGCPGGYGYGPESCGNGACPGADKENCTECWNKVIPGTEDKKYENLSREELITLVKLLEGRVETKDRLATRQMCEWYKHNPYICNLNKFEIEKVIFNDPATIVFWSDGTKTVVKTQNGETFDPEKGLAMAIAKKTFGNKGNYFNHISKWVDKYEEQKRLDKMLEDSLITTEMAAAAFKEAAERIKKLGERMAKLE